MYVYVNGVAIYSAMDSLFSDYLSIHGGDSWLLSSGL